MTDGGEPVNAMDLVFCHKHKYTNTQIQTEVNFSCSSSFVMCVWQIGCKKFKNNGTYRRHGRACFSLHTKADELTYEQKVIWKTLHVLIDSIYSMKGVEATYIR